MTPEPLNVNPGLVGLPLATPWRRSLAMALDLAVVALLAESGNLWLWAGLVLVVLQLRNRRHGQENRRRLGWLLAALLLWLAIGQAWDLWQAHGASPARPATAAAAATAAATETATETAAATTTTTATTIANTATAAARAADADRADVGDVGDGEARSQAEAASQPEARRIARLEAELAAARAARPKTVREQAEELAESVASSFGWGIVYFSLLPAWWGGQTLGKRALGLRVLQLTGEPVTVMTSLKRYGGYAAGMATGGIGFAQVLWDPNRQGLQDKAAHTVVVDLRAPQRPDRAGIPQAGPATAAAILPPDPPTPPDEPRPG